MPIPVRRDPFPKETESLPELRVPQARVLSILQPESIDTPAVDWPVLTWAMLSRLTGYSQRSGTVNRALNGIPCTCRTGEAHEGLLGMGMVVERVLDIEGMEEVNYRATEKGVRAYQAFVVRHGELPAVREKTGCVNKRYRKEIRENDETNPADERLT